jgi:hypothetical protein
MKRFAIICVLCFFTRSLVSSQEALKSPEEEYYDFLALRGLAERPSLNYRTLSDSVWTLNEETAHPWQNQNLGKRRGLFGDVFIKIYGPELFMSVNTAAPYGQNDGALWQGRGFNTSFTGGVRLEGYGLELTFKPQLAFSQNMAFEIMKSNYDSEYGYFWGYARNIGIDAPQRFGDKPFFTYDWGDSEVRYSWKTLTIGFGTQAIWLGPAHLNPILHSNNAASYPKLDIGLRRQPLTIPGINWYMGDVEFRLWTGYLSESTCFDTDSSNDHTMFHGLAFAYAPSFLPGLTLSVNRVCLVAWEWENLKYIFPSRDNTKEDQKASFGLSYIFPQVGFEVFGELGIDDFYSGGKIDIIRQPFRTTVYTFGLKKFVTLLTSKELYGEIIFESNWMEMTQHFQFEWPYSFYFHHNIIHGYTNKGQLLGNAMSPGGNSQILRFITYYPKGSSEIMIARNNPDNNYLYKNAIYSSADNLNLESNVYNHKANFILTLNTEYFLYSNLSISGGLTYNPIINPTYKNIETVDSSFPSGKLHSFNIVHNFSFQFAVKLNI